LGHVLGLGGFWGLEDELDQRRVGLGFGPPKRRAHFSRI